MPIKAVDRIAAIVILCLSLIIVLLIWGGKLCGTTCFLHTGPRINYFSWENKRVGADDLAFIIGFDRPVDRQSVVANLQIEPNLPGKISWSGRRMAYTLEQPIPYGERYQISIFGAVGVSGEAIQPFNQEIISRDRALAFIGTTGSNLGRLILYNWTKQEEKILTPDNLIVTDFKFYPQGNKILFAAADRQDPDIIRKLQLYTVTTGLNGDTSTPKITLILDNHQYQNNYFDISADGQKIVLQRIKRSNPLDFDLWLIESEKPPRPLNTQGGDFLIAPDSQTLAVAEGEGITLLSLSGERDTLNFLPKFGQVLSFSRDGSAAAMVNFNTDNADLRYTRSLFYVNNRGLQKELINTTGSIIDCQFNHSGSSLYCLLTELVEGEIYQEIPYFAAINIDTKAIIPLVELDNYQDIEFHMSPDGLGLIFDQVITDNQQANLTEYKTVQYINNLFNQFTSLIATNQPEKLRTDSGAEIIGGNLWLLLIPPTELKDATEVSLEELPFAGFRPQWSP